MTYLKKTYNEIEQALVDGLKRGLCVLLWYKNELRLVEVHAVGMTRGGNMCARVWQVSGQTPGWKLLSIDGISLPKDSPSVIPEKSLAPRPGYRMGDSQMALVYEEFKLKDK